MPVFSVVFTVVLLAGLNLAGVDLGLIEWMTVLLIILLQSTLPYYGLVNSRVASIERMAPGERIGLPPYSKWLPLILSTSPLIFLYNSILAMLIVTGVWLSIAPYIYKLFVRKVKKEDILNNNLTQLHEYSPQLVIYVSGLAKVAYQINQWLPVLERLHVKPLVLIRERRIVRGINDTEIPIFYARTMVDVETIYDAAGDGLSVVLYPANTMKNVQSLRHSRLQHYFINHGESDKSVNQSKLLMAYDKLLVGGPLAEQRLRDSGLPVRHGQIEYVGRPQAEILLDQKKEGKEIETILYAPTWEGFVEDADYCSVREFGLSVISELASTGDYKLIIKLHPYTGHRNVEVREAMQNMKKFVADLDSVEWIDAAEPIHECMNRSDLLITDISSVLNEYLVTRKPMVLMNVRNDSPQTLQDLFPSTRACYVMNKGGSITELINDISLNDSKECDRQEVRRLSLGEFPEGALQRFENIILETVGDSL